MGRFSVYHDRAYAGGAVAQPMRNGPSVGAGRPGASTGLGRALWPGIGRIIGLGTTRRRGRREDGPPVYTYETVPGVPPVGAMRLGRGFSGVRPGAHSHDFLVLDYFERDGGSLRLGDKQWRIEAGDGYISPPARSQTRAASKRPKDGASTSRPTSSGPRPPAPSSPGAPTHCSSPSCGARR